MVPKYNMTFKNINVLPESGQKYETWRKGNRWYQKLSDHRVSILLLSQDNEDSISRYGIVENDNVNIRNFYDIAYSDLRRKGYNSFQEAIDEMTNLYGSFDPYTDCVSIIQMELL